MSHTQHVKHTTHHTDTQHIRHTTRHTTSHTQHITQTHTSHRHMSCHRHTACHTHDTSQTHNTSHRHTTHHTDTCGPCPALGCTSEHKCSPNLTRLLSPQALAEHRSRRPHTSRQTRTHRQTSSAPHRLLRPGSDTRVIPQPQTRRPSCQRSRGSGPDAGSPGRCGHRCVVWSQPRRVGRAPGWSWARSSPAGAPLPCRGA